jgi:hypothetical protein
MALVNLAEDDQRHREVVDLAELAIEVDRRLRGAQAVVVAALRERAIRHREVRIQA